MAVIRKRQAARVERMVEGEIRDASNGEIMPARVYIQGADGTWNPLQTVNTGFIGKAPYAGLAMAIGYSLNVQRIPEGVLRTGDGAIERADAEVDEARIADPAPHPTAVVPNLRDRFAGLSSRLNR